MNNWKKDVYITLSRKCRDDTDQKFAIHIRGKDFTLLYRILFLDIKNQYFLLICEPVRIER